MPAKSTKKVSLKETPSRLETSESQTDAPEWVEFEMDMDELHEMLKEEGIDVPVDERGTPVLTPEFIKNLPPSVKPHAGGKIYAGGKPFKSTLAPPPTKGSLEMGDQMRISISITEEYKIELNELYKALEKNGVKVPRDEDGVPIFDENLIKQLPPEDVPHPGKEYTPIAGLPPLPDGTRVSPRLTIRLLTPALEQDLLKLCKEKGIEVPILDEKPEITSDFIRSLPSELLQIVLQPIYDNQKKLSEKRESAIRKLSVEKTAPLTNLLEKEGIEVKKTEQGEPIIPLITIMQFTEDEVSEPVGPENMLEIFKPEEVSEAVGPENMLEIFKPGQVGDAEDDDYEFDLTDDQREDFYDKLIEEGIRTPMDEVTGKPRFTREFLRTIPKKIAREILSVAAVNGDEQVRSSRFSSPSEDSDEEYEYQGKRNSNIQGEESQVKPDDMILGLRYTPEGLTFIADEQGQRVKYENIVVCLKDAYSDSSLKKHDESNKEKEANLRAAIREERRHEEKDPEIKRAGSEVEMQQMTMKFIPEYNPKPEKTDPINLFEHAPKTVHPPSASQAPQRGVEFVHILEPTFPLGKVDSLATVPSTMARRFSKDSVRGSALSTRLSDMPSMFSQALTEDPSTALVTASTQEFDVTPESISDYRERWLSSFMSGYTPKQTMTISIINMITRKQIELRVCNNNTLNEVCHMYMQYEDHPEYYVWKDIYGRVLIPEKTLIENGLMRHDEVLEFQGYRRMPVILLYFRDGFENDPPLPLNPLHALKQREPGLCRNY